MDLSPSIISALENIYISPLELCNLNCRLCYTNKTKNILSNVVILDFIDRYNQALASSKNKFLRNFNAITHLTDAKNSFEDLLVEHEKPKNSSKGLSDELRLKSILFCGGEVFTLPDFPTLINAIQSKGIFISIITNGTIDKLEEIKDPQNCQLLVSFDGPREVHDQNRGSGMFDRSLKFVDHALTLGFPVEIMFLVTPQSYAYIDSFDIQGLRKNYITQKTKFYTDKHPLSNTQSSPGLTPQQIINIKRNYPSIPDKSFGCFQISLQSNGNLYGCCETPYSLGKIDDNLHHIIDKFIASLNTCSACRQCGGCTSPNFLCGYKKELQLISCQEVAKKFNEP